MPPTQRSVVKKRKSDHDYVNRHKDEPVFRRKRAENAKNYRARKKAKGMTDREIKKIQNDNRIRKQRQRKRDNEKIFCEVRVEVKVIDIDNPRSVSSRKREAKKRKAKITALTNEIDTWRKRFHREKKRRQRLQKCFQSLQCRDPSPTKKTVRDILASKTKTHNGILSFALVMKSLAKGGGGMAVVTAVAEEIRRKYKTRVHSFLAKCACVDIRKLRKKTPRKSRRNLIVDKLVRDFYVRDDNSRLSSGKKEVKMVKNHGPEQLRYLSDFKGNLFLKFSAEFPQKCKLAKFYSLCPTFVIRAKSNKQCLCQRCTNLELLIHALWTNGYIISYNKGLLLTAITCANAKDPYSCAIRTCEDCHALFGHDPSRVQTGQVVSYSAWERNAEKNGTFCIEKRATAAEALCEFERQLSVYAGHQFRINAFYAHQRTLRASLSDMEAIIHIDFSENWSCRRAMEVQAAHFGGSHAQVTIHQGIIYFKVRDINI
jgi:hypothetical protein